MKIYVNEMPKNCKECANECLPFPFVCDYYNKHNSKCNKQRSRGCPLQPLDMLISKTTEAMTGLQESEFADKGGLTDKFLQCSICKEKILFALFFGLGEERKPVKYCPACGTKIKYTEV